MIPLTLITGFLGSGKTTLLQFLIEQARSRRWAFIINEFGTVDIDGQLLDLPPDRLVSIPGGSIFCRCLAGSFIRVLRQVADLPAASAVMRDVRANVKAHSAPEGVVVEASGIADPKVVGQMLAETRLNTSFDLRQVVTVVDPGSFLKLLHTLPNIIAQVEAADLAVINKTDLYGDQQIQETHDRVRQVNAAVNIVRAQYCRIPIDLFGEPDPAEEPVRPPAGEYAPCADPNYIARTLSFRSTVDRAHLNRALERLRPLVYRAKGFVPTTDGRVYVDVSAAGVLCRPAEREGPCELVIIAAPAQQDIVTEFARRLQDEGRVNTPPSG